ncbi:fluoride efflux transporter CrcB [Uliginosibacterium sediminicola]|uniref:Fluoride-specific ion channel FluC n=1 Tax=Uliginosibacterium sediminicola TaxID=2024550 RepID=A0ABU9YZL0_9RHOO
MWLNLGVIGAGAAVGAWARWLLGLALNPLLGALPLGTLAANLIGGYLMGVALAFMGAWPEMPMALRLLLTTGFLGGLTTFSSFSGEVFQMFQRQQIGWALAAIAVHVCGSLLMTALGWWSYLAITR